MFARQRVLQRFHKLHVVALFLWGGGCGIAEAHRMYVVPHAWPPYTCQHPIAADIVLLFENILLSCTWFCQRCIATRSMVLGRAPPCAHLVDTLFIFACHRHALFLHVLEKKNNARGYCMCFINMLGVANE